ncbi:MAG: hypothetical protein ACI8QS_003452 [Planctomycetota bacterium]|jgi:hypothetical protein
MLQAARLAPKLLAEAAPLITTFLEGELNADGGAADREGKSDLYYTAFALDALVALRAELPVERVRRFLEGFGLGEELDLVHRASLVRCWASLMSQTGEAVAPALRAGILEQVEANRSADGGYAARAGAPTGTLYNSFLAAGVYQDLGATMPLPFEMGASFEALRTPDGGYANAVGIPLGTTPAASAAAALLVFYELEIPEGIDTWILDQRHPQGGFKAMPEAPIPDLLSTATSLHALACLRKGERGLLGRGHGLTLDFIDSLWTGKAFFGHWDDDCQDAEYVFYGLLALGHLALDS